MVWKLRRLWAIAPRNVIREISCITVSYMSSLWKDQIIHADPGEEKNIWRKKTEKQDGMILCHPFCVWWVRHFINRFGRHIFWFGHTRHFANRFEPLFWSQTVFFLLSIWQIFGGWIFFRYSSLPQTKVIAKGTEWIDTEGTEVNRHWGEGTDCLDYLGEANLVCLEISQFSWISFWKQMRRSSPPIGEVSQQQNRSRHLRPPAITHRVHQ